MTSIFSFRIFPWRIIQLDKYPKIKEVRKTSDPISSGRRYPKNIVADRIRLARHNREPRVSQEELSALLGAYGVTINQAGISKIEAGDRPVYDYELKALAEALVVSVTWLVDAQEL